MDDGDIRDSLNEAEAAIREAVSLEDSDSKDKALLTAADWIRKAAGNIDILVEYLEKIEGLDNPGMMRNIADLALEDYEER